MAKILAVDDDVAILHMIETILNKDGHLVTTASSPLEINMEKVNLYDLILLDIMMRNRRVRTVFKNQETCGLSYFVSYSQNRRKQSGKWIILRSRRLYL